MNSKTALYSSLLLRLPVRLGGNDWTCTFQAGETGETIVFGFPVGIRLTNISVFPQEDSELDRRRALYGSARMLPLDAGHFDLGMPPKKRDHHQNNETIDANKKTHTKTKNNRFAICKNLIHTSDGSSSTN